MWNAHFHLSHTVGVLIKWPKSVHYFRVLFKYRALISNIGQMFSSAFLEGVWCGFILLVCGLEINVLPDIMARFFSKASGKLTLCKWCTDSHAITTGMSYLLFPANDSGSIPWKSGVMDTIARQLFMTRINIIMTQSTII